jgi:hypothetical protein
MHAGQVAISRALYGTKELFEVPDPLTELSNVVAYSCRQFFKGSAPWPSPDTGIRIRGPISGGVRTATNVSATRVFARLCGLA